MTVHFIEGFSHYPHGTSADDGMSSLLQKNWLTIDSPGTVGTSRPRITEVFAGMSSRFPGTRFYQAGSVSRSFITSRPLPALTSYCVGSAIRCDPVTALESPSVSTHGLLLGTVFLRVHPEHIRVTVGGTTVVNVPHPGIGTVWNYYEMAVDVHGSAGTVTVYLNGVEIASATGLNTGSSPTDLRVGKQTTNNDNGRSGYTDIYLADEALGDFRVVTLWPDGAGHHTDLTPDPTAANYTRVNTQAQNDATRNFSDTPGDKDTYTYDDLPHDDVAVHCVSHSPRVRKEDAGLGSGRALLRTGSTDFHGPDLILSTSAQWFPTIWSANPDTLLPWEAVDIDAIEAGLEVR
jgi:hypothetical protein